jgi:hypothetical protein
MRHLLTPRRLVLVYALAGLLAGIGFSTWHFWGSLDGYYRKRNGELTRTAQDGGFVILTDPATGDTCLLLIRGTRPLTFWDKFWLRLPSALPILFAGAGVGLFWGLVHLKIQGAIADPFGDEQRLDYEDSTCQNLPPVST